MKRINIPTGLSKHNMSGPDLTKKIVETAETTNGQTQEIEKLQEEIKDLKEKNIAHGKILEVEAIERLELKQEVKELKEAIEQLKELLKSDNDNDEQIARVEQSPKIEFSFSKGAPIN